ncbi:MAG TPA: transposase, partial [Longimicrobiaceae bacterium]|nr:transposase [Longimicrobiaceae bacterium]
MRLRHSAGELSDGGGLLLLRRLWDRLGLGERIDTEAAWLRGQYRPSLMVELWIVLLLYGGGCMDDLRLLGGRGIRRLFGWKALPDPTTFGRWLRRGGERLAEQLDGVLWQMVRARWAVAGVPRSVMLVLDSTVVQRYGLKQAGAEKGYNPTKKGRPSHHPLVAFLAETGDCLGVRWRGGSAHTAAGAIPWIQTLVEQLRAAGVEQITVRLDKGFFSRQMAEALSALGVDYVLKVPDQKWLRRHLSPFRRSQKTPQLWTASGTLYGARLLTVEQRREIGGAEGELALESYEVGKTAHVLTNVEGISALSAWRLY